jgi:hypothetical protein
MGGIVRNRIRERPFGLVPALAFTFQKTFGRAPWRRVLAVFSLGLGALLLANRRKCRGSRRSAAMRDVQRTGNAPGRRPPLAQDLLDDLAIGRQLHDDRSRGGL